MTKAINDLKNSLIFEEERDFFKKYKKDFIASFGYHYKLHYNCEHCILDVQTIASNFYDALFDNAADSYPKQLCCLFRMSENKAQYGFFFAELITEMTEAFLNQNRADEKIIQQSKKILEIFKQQMKVISKLPSKEDESYEFSSHFTLQNSNIKYLKNLHNLGRGIKFFVHTQIGTSMSIAPIIQIGNSSIVIKVNEEQMTALKLSNNSFILQNSDNEKNFSAKAKILCAKELTVVLENIKELDKIPLLSRKYPRAAIMHASLVHLANENEYITGNMLDISEGGVGVISNQKSSFEKGQSVVAFLSYEDPKKNFKFSFEATGYIVSIIGKENAFRYGVSLDLSTQEKELIKNLINFS
jgi:hypothetical protein